MVVVVSDRVRLDWSVPSRAWRLFREHVEDENAAVDGSYGREADEAMKQYADADGYDEVESLVDRLVQAAGRTPDGSRGEKNEIDKSEKTRVVVRVDPDVKEQFSDFVEESDEHTGEVFARAITAYRNGGRPDRLERKLRRVVDDAESVLSELNDSSDDGITAVERKTIAVCNELPDQFVDDELVETIERVADVHSKPSIRKYRKRVVSRLDVEPHPTNSELWVPESVAAEIAPDGVPKVCRQSVEHLDREDRERRLKLEVGRRAAKQDSGKLRVSSTTVHEDVFDGKPSKSTSREILENVSRDDAFSLDETRSKTYLRVNLNEMRDADPVLLEEIVEYRDAGEDSSTSDFERSSSRARARETDDVEREAAETEALLESATIERPVATDGGEPGSS